jgi:tetratricopeptide (TPR) repeat protein
MGFFIRDLHEEIEELHRNQVGKYHGKLFIVYRGQGLSKVDFEKLQKTKGGLISFNNFLSTSRKREVSLSFANNTLTKTNMIGILFQMSIDPSVSSTPFASIQKMSHINSEKEILFSLNTVFRIGEIKSIDKNNTLYEVNLTLTADDDPQLRVLSERIRQEVVGETGWKRLGQLLIKLSHFDKADELYNTLLEQTNDERKKASYYNQLGYIKNGQGNYQKAIEYYEQAREIKEKILPSNHPALATSCNNIANVSFNMGDYLKALSFHQKALQIRQKSLANDHPALAITYDNLGLVYYKLEDYSKALSFHEKALAIEEKTLPSNHPAIATSYNNIAGVYYIMNDYFKALCCYGKAHKICKRALPPNHPDMAASYNNIGMVYKSVGEHSKALSFYEKALEIYHKTLSSNHPSLATAYYNIGLVLMNMEQYSRALSHLERALNIFQSSSSTDHRSIQKVQLNIEALKQKLRN